MSQKTLVLAALVVCVWWVGAVASAELLPALQEEIVPRDWLAVGPFQTARGELYIDHLSDHGGEANIRPLAGMRHPSALALGAWAVWKPIRADDDGNLRIYDAYDDLPWDIFIDSEGGAVCLHTSYAYTEFESLRRQRALLEIGYDSLSHICIWVNGEFAVSERRRSRLGPEYLPVVLREGTNRVLLKQVQGRPGGSFRGLRIRLLPPSNLVFIDVSDSTVPDLVRGEGLEAWVSVTLVNTSLQPLTGVRVEVPGDDVFAPASVNVPRIPPLTRVRVPFRLQTNTPVSDDLEQASFTVIARWDGGEESASIPLRVKNPEDLITLTLLSKLDGSVQNFSVIRPLNYDPDEQYALYLSLHGAEVNEDYVLKDYTAKEGAVLSAPYGRGLGYRGISMWDSLEVLEETQRLFHIDPDRVYLVGHSQGGFGTWYIGLHFPDLWAGLSAQASYVDRMPYTPGFLSRSHFAPPQVHAHQQRAYADGRLIPFAVNALHLPCFVLHGQLDDNVTIVHARRMVRELRALGYRVAHKEIPGKRHWWNTSDMPGRTPVNYPGIFEFLSRHRREPSPNKVIFRGANLGINNKAYWVRIDRQERMLEVSEVRGAIRSGNRIELHLENVAALTLTLPSDKVEVGLPVEIHIARQRLEVPEWDGGPIQIHRGSNGYVLGLRPARGLAKKPGLWGPMRQVYCQPHLFVYGTCGSPKQNEANFRCARIAAEERARSFVGRSPLKADSEVTSEDIGEKNLVLFGGPESNSITAQVLPALPFDVSEHGVEIGGKLFKGKGNVLRANYPNPLNPERLLMVNAASDAESMQLINEVMGFGLYADWELGDYFVFDASIKEKGLTNVLAIGFFDQDWQFDPDLGYVRR